MRDDGMVTREDRVGKRGQKGKVERDKRTYENTRNATFRNYASDAANTTTILKADEAFRAIPSATMTTAATTTARI